MLIMIGRYLSILKVIF